MRTEQKPEAGLTPSDSEIEALLNRGYRYALSLTHDEGRAEDLVHDAAVAILRRGSTPSLAYFLTTIRNRFIDLYRRERLVVMEPLDETGEEALAAFEEQDSAVDPERLEEALGTLRPPEREALYLAAVESYTMQEIADLTDRPRGTVLSLIHRARVKLRTFFAGLDREARKG